ncbi:MAG: trypsin-like peptidase domain-containing protein [Bernardetiaceae bacterium]|nr:trypsin-like peptidase domain-containing protein [Bernardetiaceae bacterium]
MLTPFDIEEAFVNASAVGSESVIYIKTYTKSQPRQSWIDLFFDRRAPQDGQNRQAGSGSGVIFSKEGYIVTNNHVIAGAEKIEVIHQKRSYIAEIVGTDPSSDLALIKIDAPSLKPVKVASSSSVRIGEWVIAIGNPFNLTSTVTAGIVSAKSRNLALLGGQFPIESFIQTDAAINPGNSGGALVNLKGELIGINTAILSQTGSYAGYGFAVPSDIVIKIIGDLKKYGEVQKAFIGADAREIDEELGNKLNMEKLEGVVLSQIDKDAAAQKAGLERGDIIIGIDNYTISSKSDFDEVLSYYSPGDKINVKYLRKNKVRNTQLLLTNINGTTDIVRRETIVSEELGADFEQVPLLERNKLGIKQGIRVKNVHRGFIQKMRIPTGFIITEVENRQRTVPIDSVDLLLETLKEAKGWVAIKGVHSNGEKDIYTVYF